MLIEGACVGNILRQNVGAIKLDWCLVIILIQIL